SEQANGHSKQENAQILKQKLEALEGIVDGFLKLEVGINFNPDGFDVCLYSEFSSKEALNAYQVHPEHVLVKEYVPIITCDRAVADYEV
ncbi:MAG: Stress responsive alpha-beta barrel protein, partial [Caproiciproducens sp.]|nr:Stress responsive alpha-beta barrel protein [Caproiciproducens sp.]